MSKSKKRQRNLPLIHSKDLKPSDFRTIVHIDGYCENNPGGPGSYAGMIEVPETNFYTEFAAAYLSTTNNRMELRGAVGALARIVSEDLPSPILIVSDSKYVVNSFECGWAENWRSKNYVNKDSIDGMRANHDLFRRALDLMNDRTVRFQWVKGHNGHEKNEKCDAMALSAMNLELKPDLKII